MKKSIKNRIRLTENIINKKGTTANKKARYERKLAILKDMLAQEKKENIKYIFKTGEKQQNESGYVIVKNR